MRLRILGLTALTLTGVYLYAFPSAAIPYLVTVLAHVVGGFVFAVLLPPVLWRIRALPASKIAGWTLVAGGAALGIVLTFAGASRPLAPLLYSHVLLSALGLIFLLAGRPVRFILITLAAVAVGSAAWSTREASWRNSHRIQNPVMPPESQDFEGEGIHGDFFPSSAKTSHGRKIDSKFFMQSEACERCHPDIYEAWSGSMHRFSSFNNQWYRKSIEYMQDVAGVRPSKWCAGCHDPALLFSGMFDTPVQQLLDKPEAHAGLGCVMCHSVASVNSTMGQGDYTIEYPRLAELAASENKLVQRLHDFLVHVNPEPHRRTFMKPFLRQQPAEFCSSCHKVHLDTHVNNYRWVRGFNDYDNWQASGISGMGARSFYYPPQPRNCVDCHMPMVNSRDAGNLNGKVHSHRFPGANTAVPFVNQDVKQMDAVTKFLQDNIVSVDIFAISPARPPDVGTARDLASGFSTMFAVGEEMDPQPPAAALPLKGEANGASVVAPLDRVDAAVQPGGAYRIDVVVRTRKIGHFFPGGTVDAFDVWLDLQATDDNGRILFWSGMVEDNGKGPVEKGAHFYRSLQVDGHGNPINKRNAWAARSLVYVRLIPPGAADTVRYRFTVPKNAAGAIHLKARLRYRKFAWWNTQFAFAGERVPGGPAPTKDYDDGRWTFTGDTSNVSGKVKAIPDVPILTLAEDTAVLRVSADAAGERRGSVESSDWERWNDYGIGLFLQGDLRAAEAAFSKAAEIDPNNPDGFVNIGRVRLQEGNLDGARDALEHALKLSPDLARAHFFYARVRKADGFYDDALAHLRTVIRQYPRDRVVRNEAGRVLFLQKRYAEAVKEFESVLEIDPEDLQAHYNLMLCYNGLGDEKRAVEHQKRYLRFKADESAQAVTGPYRLSHPEDNNERQPIHEHVDGRGK